jgi:hypothetical protein
MVFWVLMSKRITVMDLGLLREALDMNPSNIVLRGRPEGEAALLET